MVKMKKLLPPLLFVAGVLAGCFLSRHLCPFLGHFSHVNVKVDTLYVRDTLRVETPVFIERHTVDTMVVSVTEFQVVHDTAFVQLPREQVEYRDTSYRAVVSGFLPRLEELEIYQREKVVTIQTEKVVRVPDAKRWGVGVQAGYGITPAGFQPYLGLGVSYNFLRF